MKTKKTFLKVAVPLVCIVSITAGCSNVNAINRNKEQSKLVVMEDRPLDILIEQDKEMQEEFILKLKTMLNIGDEYVNTRFHLDENEHREEVIQYKTSWQYPNQEERDLRRIYVTVNEDGWVTSYRNQYADGIHKENTIDKESAIKIAEEFIKKTNPQVTEKIELVNDSKIENSYAFKYARKENNIPFYNNEVRISINSSTGQV